MVPCDDEEHLLIDCWTLSLKSGFSSSESDTQIIMMFCEKHELDALEVVRTCKQMTTELNSVKK